MALVLKRKRGQALWIDQARLEFRVVGGDVTVKIDAPANVHVVREEILEHDGSDVYGVKRPVAREQKNAN